MNAAPAALDFRTLAPAFAGRFAVIIAALLALIARAFLHHPTRAPLIVPLYRRFTRTTRRVTALMARLAAGSGASPAARRPRGQAPQRSRAPKPPIPSTEAWLVRTLAHEAAAYGSQLSHLLNEPGMSELLDAAPGIRPLLRPLCRMLGINPATVPPLPRRPRPEPAGAQPSEPEPPPRPPAMPPPPCPHVRWSCFARYVEKRREEAER